MSSRSKPRPDDASLAARARGRLGPWWVLGVSMLVGLGLVAVDQLRLGGLVVGLGFLVAALLRALVAPERIGALQVRSRALDIAMFVAMGAVVLVAAFAVKPDVF